MVPLTYSKAAWKHESERIMLMSIGNPNDKSTMPGADKRLIWIGESKWYIKQKLPITVVVGSCKKQYSTLAATSSLQKLEPICKINIILKQLLVYAQAVKLPPYIWRTKWIFLHYNHRNRIEVPLQIITFASSLLRSTTH